MKANDATHLSVLSNSAVSCFRRCPREFLFRYKMLRRPVRTSEALAFGTLFHLGLNAWWSMLQSSPSARLAAAVVAMRGGDADEVELIKAEELMVGYTARWADEVWTLVGAVEAQFDVPLVNPDTGAASRTYSVAGAMDAIAVRGSDGRTFQIEHKTTSSDLGVGADYWRTVSATDSQVSVYQAAADAMGLKLSGCIYDVVRKVNLRPRLATPVENRRYTKKGHLDARQREDDETLESFRGRVREAIELAPEKYYGRGEVVRLDHDKAGHASDMWQTAAMIRECENAGRFPRSPGSCSRWGRMCDYFEVCSGSATIEDDRFRTAEVPHEELEKEV